jgi:hypothetical protein
VVTATGWQVEALRIAIGVALALFVGRVYWRTVFGGDGRRWYWPLKLLAMFLLYVCMMTVAALFVVLLGRFLHWGSTGPVLRWVLAVPLTVLLWGFLVLVAVLYVGLCGYVAVALAGWFCRRINEDGKSKTQNLFILIREHIWLPALVALLLLLLEWLHHRFHWSPN